jgi:putative FmdB family regulatory protein
MPLFDFECSDCAAVFESYVSSSNAARCACGSTNLKKMAGAFAVGKASKKRTSRNDGGKGDHIGNRAAAARASGKTHSCC